MDFREGTHLKSMRFTESWLHGHCGGFISDVSKWGPHDFSTLVGGLPQMCQYENIEILSRFCPQPSMEWIIPESFVCERPMDVVSHM